jgi:hypothetical protein
MSSSTFIDNTDTQVLCLSKNHHTTDITLPEGVRPSTPRVYNNSRQAIYHDTKFTETNQPAAIDFKKVKNISKSLRTLYIRSLKQHVNILNMYTVAVCMLKGSNMSQKICLMFNLGHNHMNSVPISKGFIGVVTI